MYPKITRNLEFSERSARLIRSYLLPSMIILQLLHIFYPDMGMEARRHRSDLKEITQRVGRNQATMMRICHRWIHEDQQSRSHPPRCTTPVMTGGLRAWQ
ncbi:hypothetical protein TNCV_503971 [Trichonephila clavipes]|nr:hypothetical protein TNCV_503971 [Trichonephila clavipes]